MIHHIPVADCICAQVRGLILLLSGDEGSEHRFVDSHKFCKLLLRLISCGHFGNRLSEGVSYLPNRRALPFHLLDKYGDLFLELTDPRLRVYRLCACAADRAEQGIFLLALNQPYP